MDVCNETESEITPQEAKIEPEVEKPAESSEKSDEFAYLDRNFSSEAFKIELRKLPKYYGINEMRKLLNEKLKLNANKVKAPFKGAPYMFICFRNEEDRVKALEVLNGYSFKGKTLMAVKSKPTPDPFFKKRKSENEGAVDSKKLKAESLTVEEQIKQSSTPIVDIPYEQQVEKKESEVRSILKRLANDIAKNNSELNEYIQKQKRLYDGLPCELIKTKSTDVIDGYRNKCDFTIGINEETKLPTVGFRYGRYKEGTIGVGPVQNLRHIPEIMKKACLIFENFVRNSDLKVYNQTDQSGHFRQVTVRSTTLDQLMIIVRIHPQNLTQDELLAFKKKLMDFFTEGDGKTLNITSLYLHFKMEKRQSNDNDSPELLYGDKYIYENILGLKFRISPQAFFQVNTKGAEILYKSAMDLVEPIEDTTVVDICCGTGTIGLCFAKRCKKVLGVEIIPEAVNDAKENAKDNEINNAEFFADKAENILSSLFSRAENDNVIAVVDPPRCGLHKTAMKQIRNTKKLKKIIYMACSPQGAYANFLDFTRPISKALYGEPLVPIKAVVVDMFPHTECLELVVLFEKFADVENREESTENSQ